MRDLRGIIRKCIREANRVDGHRRLAAREGARDCFCHHLPLKILSACEEPEIKEILARKQEIRFFEIENDKVRVSLKYVDKGISMGYEENMGFRKELAGAQMYKQAEMNLSRYFTYVTGMEDLLKSTNEALRFLVDVLTDKEIPETDVWNAISKGKQVQCSFPVI